jgi:hypothetical protein
MTDQKERVTIRFENLSLAEAGTHAANLQGELLALRHDESGQELESVSLQKDSKGTMDFGATLVLLLGTPALIVVAQGIANYLSRTGTSVTIEKDGAVVIKGVRGADAARIVEAVKGRKGK